MKLFHNDQDEKLIKLLKQARIDFLFNPQPTKTRLMKTLAEVEPNHPSPKLFNVQVLRYSVMTLGLIVVASAGVVYASTGSEPGDTLFAVNKLGSKILLSLPIGDERKALYHERIVNHRLESLNKIEAGVKTSQFKVESRGLKTIEESDLSLNQAIEAISLRKQALEQAGKTEAAEKLSQTLTKLEGIAGLYEKKIQALESETNDEKVKTSIQEHLIHIQDARTKARSQLTPSLKSNSKKD